ncbi:hypothetical protein [Halosolutus halophilus]|uniref:hypothetical protein n=1 Tax=Halosolutus halophilus TaxID=1552990 RepID=UPI00223507AE|nr:hypothetical protein [Halosolutus halophilus]
MSNESGLTDVVTEEVTNQVGISELLGDGNLEDEIDGDEIGAAVGRKFGEQIGRELGGSIGREVHEALARGVEEGKSLSELRSDVTSGVRDGVGDALDEIGGREALESLAGSAADGGRLGGLLDRDESAGEQEVEDEEEAEEDEATEDEEETEEDEASEDEEEPSEGEESADEADKAEPDSEPSAEDLEDLRRETLSDFLGVMSYQDLQSIAKDVDVKANLSREEMTDEIIETVSGKEDESEGTDGESADDEATQEAE